MTLSKKIIFIGIICLWTFITLCSITLAYKQTPPNQVVHQYITNESLKVWLLTPSEIKNHINQSISNSINGSYDVGDDIITGSGEEDLTPSTLVALYRNHYFDPDSPEDEVTGFYSKGLLGITESAYTKSRNYWTDEVLPYYTGVDRLGRQYNVDQDKAYYYLGRVVHLLEDISQPSHVLMDSHSGFAIDGDSVLEEFTANAGYWNSNRNFYHWSGSTYAGEQYNYENLISNFNWSKVEPTDAINQQNIDLFKLFWYTAQKTSYFGSDNVDRDFTYTYLNGSTYNWNCASPSDDNLWKNQNASLPACSSLITELQLEDDDAHPNNEGSDVAAEADAVVPHAMRAVAGLYRLFWDTVRNELRLDIPVNPSNPNVPDKVYGGVKNGGIWQTELNVSTNLKIKVILDYDGNCSNNISLTLASPSGNSYSNFELTCSKQVIVPEPQQGMWNVTIKGNSVTPNIQRFTLYAKLVTPEASETTGPGGINFTSLNLNYLSTCDPNEVTFVLKGKEASVGDTIINVTNATVNAMDYFLIGLVIPNNRLWITLDLVPGEGGACCGYVGDTSRIDNNLKQTRLGQTLLEADVSLKFDQFGQDAEAYERTMLQDWINLVQASPYWSEIQAKNFNTYPTGMRRTWIFPSKLEANGSGCTVFVTNLTLNVSYVWDFISLDLSSYRFSTDIENDLNSRLQTWKTRHIQGHYGNVTNTTIWEINNAPKYEELRRAAASLALAQWYKNQDWSAVPFGDVINTNNLTGLNVSFNETYWNNQAWQYLYRLNNGPSFLPGEWWWDWYGGVLFSTMAPTMIGNISNYTAAVMENATLFSYVRENQTIYFSTIKNPERSDLSPADLSFSSFGPDSNETINITVVVRNEGEVNYASLFKIKFSYSYTYPNGYTAQYLIGEQSVNGLNVDETKFVKIETSLPLIGAHNITAEVDYNDAVEEINELNNKISAVIQILNPNPTANMISPVSGEQHQQDEIITFAGYGTDYKDAELNESLYNWTSDRDGYLGNGSVLYKNLSLGDHVIYFTVQDADGNKNLAQVLISVVPSDPPVVTLNSPSNNAVYREGETVYFDGEAIDHEDGQLTGTSLLWNSSLNGFLGYGTSLSTVSLTPGMHNITLQATDSSGVAVKKFVNISVQESTPAVNITLPVNGSQYTHVQNVTFNATATDPHDGTLSSKINWTSSRDYRKRIFI